MPESEIAEARLFDNRTPESVIADAEERFGPFDANIGAIEREAKALGLPVCEWGSGRDFLDARRDAEDEMLCSDCQLRIAGDA